MRLRAKKWMSVCLAAALVVGGIFGGSVKQAKAATTVPGLNATLVTQFSTGVPTASSATFQMPADLTGTGTAESTAVVMPIQVTSAGMLNLGFACVGLTKSIDLYLYSDIGCTSKLGYSGYLSNTSTTDSKWYTIAAAGTYYLKAQYSSSYSLPKVAATVAVAAYSYSGSEVTLGSEYQLIYTGNSTITDYHKLILTEDSVVTLYGNTFSTFDSSAGSLSVSLTNASKIAKGDIYLSGTANYCKKIALKKGVYYIASNNDQPYQLKYTAKAIKDKSGSSKKKAKMIKKKKTAGGIVAYTESSSKADWYKVKLNKKQHMQLQISVDNNGSDRLSFQVIPANKNYRLINDTVHLSNGTHKIKSKSALKKGVYYIKVTKGYSSYSGGYKIKNLK